MFIWGLNQNEINCCDNRIISKIGISMPCFACKNENIYNVSVNCCNEPQLFIGGPKIFCLSCKMDVPNTRENDMIIFKNRCQKIERRFKYMLYKFNEYAIEDEIYNLPWYKKNLICNILKRILIKHMELYGEKVKMINMHYLLLEVFKLFGIDLEIFVPSPLSSYYEKYCEKMIDFIKTEFEFD